MNESTFSDLIQTVCTSMSEKITVERGNNELYARCAARSSTICHNCLVFLSTYSTSCTTHKCAMVLDGVMCSWCYLFIKKWTFWVSIEFLGAKFFYLVCQVDNNIYCVVYRLSRVLISNIASFCSVNPWVRALLHVQLCFFSQKQTPEGQVFFT